MVWKDEVYFGVGLEIGFVVSFVFHFMPIFPSCPLCNAVVLYAAFLRVVDENNPLSLSLMFYLVGCLI